ncbi:MAG: glutamine--fructose-6-phosphate transaminase (isomerizing) [Thermodesulfobacteriota bacterium]
MCGIIGYIGEKESTDIILSCLKKLEYRGYDSAGIAVINGRKIQVRRCEGKIFCLEEKIREEPCRGIIGIGHTRWATHGRPSERNAHPHIEGCIAIVHNGIIENHLELKELLKNKGAQFKSDTDSEVVSHLIYSFIKEGIDFESAVRASLKLLKGSYAIAALNGNEPERLIAAKRECPLVVGIGKGEYFLASDIPAILEYTREMVFLEDDEMVVADKKGTRFTNIDSGKTEKKETRLINWTPTMAEKGGYRHFMEKEIFEQPRAVIDTIRGRTSEEKGEIWLDDIGINRRDITGLKKIFIVACGTSWHAALVGKFMIERLCNIPAEVDIASEFRYRDPIIGHDSLLIPISQSGETADTLAATKLGKTCKATVASICNVLESSIPRASDGVLYTHAGPEIGVASTKAFVTQIIALYLFALYLSRRLNNLETQEVQKKIAELLKLPAYMDQVLELNSLIQKIAKRYFKYENFLYLGRGINYPIALEGALKLKEISYIHAEGYPAGEMKHGPIALIDENMPVIVIALRDRSYEKIMGNIEEVKARDGKVITIASEGDEEIKEKVDEIIFLPRTDPLLSPILTAIPLQLFAYHVAVLRGTDVDQPRNLAKSVTVE